MDMWNIQMTRHASRRAAQRGITNQFLTSLLALADREVNVGGGITALSVSRTLARALNLDDRLHRFAALLSQDGALVSIVAIHEGRNGRRYRRGLQN